MAAMKKEIDQRYILKNDLTGLNENYLGKARTKEKVMSKAWILGLVI